MFSCQKCPGDEFEHIIGTITKGETGRRKPVFFGQPLAQAERASIRIVIDILVAMLNGLQRLFTCTQRVFIGCQFDGTGDTKFTLEFLDGFTRQVRLQLLHTRCGKVMK